MDKKSISTTRLPPSSSKDTLDSFPGGLNLSRVFEDLLTNASMTAARRADDEDKSGEGIRGPGSSDGRRK